MFCYHHHLLPSSFLNLYYNWCPGTHITRIVINCRPHFCQTNINFTVLYLGLEKIWNSLPLSVSSSTTFSNFKKYLHDFLSYKNWLSLLYPAALSPILFQSIMTKSWGTPWTRLSGVSSPLTVDFIKSRFVKARFCSKHFTVILARLKKVVCYTKDFVI